MFAYPVKNYLRFYKRLSSSVPDLGIFKPEDISVKKTRKGFGVCFASKQFNNKEKKEKIVKDLELEEDRKEVVDPKSNITLDDLLEGRALINIDSKLDIVKGRYLVERRNVCWTVDITQFSEHYYLILVMDLSSRMVVGFDIKTESFDVYDVVNVFKKSIQHRGSPAICHTDQGGVFLNETWRAALLNAKTNPSVSLMEHRNQASERLNRTIKHYIRVELEKHGIPTKDRWSRAIAKINKGNDEVFKTIIKEQTIGYNNKPHKSLNEMTPINEDLALLVAETENRKDFPPTGSLLEANTNDPSAIRVRERKGAINSRFAQNAKFVIQKNTEHDAESNVDLPPNIGSLLEDPDKFKEFFTKEFDTIKLQNILLHEELKSNKEIIENSNSKINELHAALKKKQEEENMAELRRQKRKDAKRKPLRDYIQPEEFVSILSLVDQVYKGNELQIARVKIALVLLSLTGLRISNLLLFKVSHIRDLMEKGATYIDRIKRGPQNYPLVIGSEEQRVLKCFKDYIKLLCLHKEESCFLFTTRFDFNSVINRVHFNRIINSVLKVASVAYNKNWLSHSFRVTRISDLLKQFTLPETQGMMGLSSTTVDS